jgi:TPR repeat protein
MLLLFVMLVDMRPAHADLNSAVSAFKHRDYVQAFPQFLALARLGQPTAQLTVAYMYSGAMGTTGSDIDAYAWATLAAQNGEAQGLRLAKELEPDLALAPGSRRIAARVTAAYTPAALDRTLLPALLQPSARSNASRTRHRKAASDGRGTRTPARCKPQRFDTSIYPMEADFRGMQGRFVVQYTLMPDGTARNPRVVFGLRASQFDEAARAGVLMAKFAHGGTGAHPLQCTIALEFLERQYSTDDYPGLQAKLWRLHHGARQGNPQAEAFYGTLLAGLPQVFRERHARFLAWLVKGAQGGDALAQYEVAVCLQTAFGGCVPDQAKALRWLHLAAAQNEPDAEVALAVRALQGAPDAAALAAAKHWLAQAVAQDNTAAETYLSALLAASPQAAVRDPARALLLETKAYQHVAIDPTGYEIRAAAYAAQGHFAHAVTLEREAIGKARELGWTPAPLAQRLARYRSDKPWYGNLLNYSSPAPSPSVQHASNVGS